LPDFVGRKDRLVRLRNKNSNKNALTLSEVVVPETNTTYGTKYLHFRSFRRQHREGRLNLDDYILEFLDLFKFEPKKKYVEKLEDTFESDGTSISNSSTEEERNDDFNEGEQPNMDAASQASLFAEVTDEELDRYLEQVDACSSSHS